MSSIPDLPFVRDHIDNAAAYVANRFRQDAGRFLVAFPVHSPIEAVFSCWWMVLLQTGEIHETYFSLQRQHDVIAQGAAYRLDFALLPMGHWQESAARHGLPVPKVAVECDGHEFHERTREQVIERNERDRRLQADGWAVLHFAGAELNADPRRCVWDVFRQAHEAYRRLEDAISERDVDDAFLEREAAQRAADIK